VSFICCVVVMVWATGPQSAFSRQHSGLIEVPGGILVPFIHPMESHILCEIYSQISDLQEVGMNWLLKITR
jgi:hypothetical protein